MTAAALRRGVTARCNNVHDSAHALHMESSSSKCLDDENKAVKEQCVMTTLATISTGDLSMVCGGQQGAQPPQQQQPNPAADYSTNGNVVQQGGQMIDNAWGAFQGARKAGASWYESIGNAAIGALNLQGGFDRNGRPR
jgi:hypothetical protein